MTIYYSASENAFFDDQIHRDIPHNSVVLTDAEHKKILEDQSTGMIITGGADGRPILREVILSEADIAKRNKSLVQSKLDQVAQSWGYDSLSSAVGYLGDKNKRFNDDATLLAGWRSDVWSWYIAATNFDMNDMPKEPIQGGE